MTLLFVSRMDEPEVWRNEFAGRLPDLDFRLWPDVGAAEEIRYALVWRPPRGLFQGLPRLKAIFSLGAGVDGLVGMADDLPPGVPLVRMVEHGLNEGMAEYVVWQVLDWHRDGAVYRAQQTARRWVKHPALLARERRVGVLGLGVLGGCVAQALAALRFPVAGWSRTPKQLDGIDCHHGPDGLLSVAARSDILVNLLPLTPQTEAVIDAGLLAALPAGAVLINAARGRHVVAEDLLAALDGGHLSGASLDVFDPEPLPADHPFWTHPKITVTPHVAAVTLARTAVPVIVEQIGRIERGEPPLHAVDPARGY